MKKNLLFLILCFPLFLSAQLTSDDFESYTVGSFDTQWDPANWVGWFSGPSNSEISDEQASSGVNSLKIAQGNDLVALLGVLDNEGYEVTFKQYIPSGNGSYFNLQHNYTETSGSWMVEVYTAADSTGEIRTNGQAISYPVLYDQWVDIKFVFNFITGEAEFYYNNTLVTPFFIIATTNGQGIGPQQLNAINFFGTCLPGGCTSLSYYDDLLVTFVPVPPYNARVINHAPPSEYTLVPSGLEKPITLSADVWNIGAFPLTEISMIFTLKDGSGSTVYTETVGPVASLAHLEQVTFNGVGEYIISETDNYTMDYEVQVAEQDVDLSDNIRTREVPFAISNDAYAREDGQYVIGFGLQNILMGQTFDFIEPVVIEEVVIAYGLGDVGEMINGYIFSVDETGAPDTVIAASVPHEITEVGSIGNGGEVFVILNFADSVNLEAGEYIFMVEQVGATSLGLSGSATVFTPGSTWASTDGGDTWFNFESQGFPIALAIRPLVKSIQVGIDGSAENFITNLNITPNPTSDFITIDLELLETQDLVVDVFNMNGQRLKTIADNNTIGGTYQMDLRGFPTGIYFLKFQIGEQFVSRKVVLTK